MNKDTQISKALSYWLRHNPGAGALVLDPSGWAEVDAVLGALTAEKLPGTRDDLHRVIAASDKQRFELSDDGQFVRARQGHSIPVDLGWPVETPPEHLFHGTVVWFLTAIMEEGLRPMKRHHVHLSGDIDTAKIVGKRRGAPIILRVEAGRMHGAGTEFRRSSNGVWLVDAVPPEFLTVMEG